MAPDCAEIHQSHGCIKRMKVALVSLHRNINSWPQGLLALASYVRANSQHNVEIIDANWHWDISKPDWHFPKQQFDYIGISALTPDYPEACRLARLLRITHSKSKLIIGGVHITTLPESMKPCFDMMVQGPGEGPLLNILNGSNNYEFDVNTYPDFDYGLLDNRYWKTRWLNLWEEKGVAGVLMTSLGCPYRCVFCSGARYWKKVHFYPVDWVVRQIKAQAALGVTHMEFWDDLFAANKKRLRAIVEALEAEGLTYIKYRAQLKTNHLDDETCELLRRMNFLIANFGFESANQRVLSYLKAGSAKVADHYRAVELCRKHDIRPVGSFIFGSPGEIWREQLDTVKFAWWAARKGADSLWYMPLTPYPGTPVWQDALEAGTVSNDMDFSKLTMFAENYRRSIPWWIHSSMWTCRVFMKTRRLLRKYLP